MSFCFWERSVLSEWVPDFCILVTSRTISEILKWIGKKGRLCALLSSELIKPCSLPTSLWFHILYGQKSINNWIYCFYSAYFIFVKDGGSLCLWDNIINLQHHWSRSNNCTNIIPLCCLMTLLTWYPISEGACCSWHSHSHWPSEQLLVSHPYHQKSKKPCVPFTRLQISLAQKCAFQN